VAKLSSLPFVNLVVGGRNQKFGIYYISIFYIPWIRACL